MKRKNEFILTIGAHNDDYIVGAGGTLAKYRKEGKEFYSVIFSFGEMSHMHFKEDVVVAMRKKEAERADKILGGSGIEYLGIREGTFMDNKEAAIKQLTAIINRKKPDKVFTHSDQDPHPDHYAVSQIVFETLRRMKYKGDVYSFDVWNIFRFKKQEHPQLVVDIKDTFKLKIDSFKAHKSQKAAIWSLMWNLYFKAVVHGIRHGYGLCEVCTKVTIK